MWIQVEDIHKRKSCINLDYISCINPNENSVDIVFSDGAVAQIKPTFINADGRESSTYFTSHKWTYKFLLNLPIDFFIHLCYNIYVI